MPSVPTSFTSVPGVQALDYTNKRQNAETAVGKKNLDSSLLLVQHLEGRLLLLDLPARNHDDDGSGNESNVDNDDDVAEVEFVHAVSAGGSVKFLPAV